MRSVVKFNHKKGIYLSPERDIRGPQSYFSPEGHAWGHRSCAITRRRQWASFPSTPTKNDPQENGRRREHFHQRRIQTSKRGEPLATLESPNLWNTFLPICSPTCAADTRLTWNEKKKICIKILVKIKGSISNSIKDYGNGWVFMHIYFSTILNFSLI